MQKKPPVAAPATKTRRKAKASFHFNASFIVRIPFGSRSRRLRIRWSRKRRTWFPRDISDKRRHQPGGGPPQRAARRAAKTGKDRQDRTHGPGLAATLRPPESRNRMALPLRRGRAILQPNAGGDLYLSFSWVLPRGHIQQKLFHSCPGTKCSHFHECPAPSGKTSDLLDRTLLQIKEINHESFRWFERLHKMLDQLARRKTPVGSRFVPGRGEIVDDCCLFFTEICFAQFRPRFFGLDLVDAGVDRNTGNPMLERNCPGELRQFLQNFDEDHLAK